MDHCRWLFEMYLLGLLLLLPGLLAFPDLSAEVKPSIQPKDHLDVKTPSVELTNPLEAEEASVEQNEPSVEVKKPVEEDATNVIVKTTDVPEERVYYNGSQLWKTFLNGNKKWKVIGQLRDKKEITTWGGNVTTADILVKPQYVRDVELTLKQNNIQYEVLIEDLQKAIDEENPPVNDQEIEELSDRTGHRMTWHAYHRLADIYNFLNFLSTSYSSLCTLYTIGSSVEGRPLKVLKISNGNPGNKAVWIDGGIHAREWISPATVTYLINHLVEKFENESPAMQNIDWHILAVGNPDGYEYSHTVDRLWRKNRGRGGHCVGTDLNRNFGYYWGGKGSGKNPCQEIYGGTGPFSEPETAAIRDYITGEKARGARWSAYLSFHSYGQYILYPWGYDKVYPPDVADLQDVGARAAQAIQQTSGAYYRVGSSAALLYPAAGGSDDWAKGAIGMKYAYTIELRDSGRYGFVLPAAYINPTAQEALAAVKVIANAVQSTPRLFSPEPGPEPTFYERLRGLW